MDSVTMVMVFFVAVAASGWKSRYDALYRPSISNPISASHLITGNIISLQLKFVRFRKMV
jgi:hypothetical protein